MVMRNKPPKGPSNQSGFGTPGTQQTAQKNVRTGGMDPYNNFAKQAQRQSRSSYQRSLTSGAPAPTEAPRRPMGTPTARPAAPRRPARRVDSFGGAELPRTGYEMLGGLPHEELLGMNQRFGLSNLTQIPGGRPLPAVPAVPQGLRGEITPPGFTPEGAGRPVLPGLTKGTLGPGTEDWAGTGSGVKKKVSGGTTYAWESGGKGHVVEAKDEDPGGYIPVYIEGKLVWLSQEDYDEYKETNKYKDNYKQNQDTYEEWEAGEFEDDKPYWEGGSPVGPEEVPAEEETVEDKIDALEADAREWLNKEQPGMNPEKVAEIKDQWHDQAMADTQAAMSQMYRQFAAMGISPASGAFAAANNQIISQAINGLLDKYATLDLQDLNQMEVDFQEGFTNVLNLAKTLVGLEGQMDQNSFTELKNNMAKIDEHYGTLFVGLLDQIGGVWDDKTAVWFQNAILGAYGQLEAGEDPAAVFKELEETLSNKFPEFETVF